MPVQSLSISGASCNAYCIYDYVACDVVILQPCECTDFGLVPRVLEVDLTYYASHILVENTDHCSSVYLSHVVIIRQHQAHI